MSDLIERLRGCSFVSKDLYIKSICKEAADEIERLSACQHLNLIERHGFSPECADCGEFVNKHVTAPAQTKPDLDRREP